MPRITPFMLPTNTSAAPKSVSSVIIGGGVRLESSGEILGLLEANVEQFVLDDFSRCLHRDCLAHALADQRAADRRLHRNLSVLQVGFVLADQCKGAWGVALQI